ncbi:MAG: transposase [Anderseniella sp.]|nr:transposase [Anderseniella sp.]
MTDDEAATDKFEFEKQLPTGDGTKKFWDEDAAYEFIEQRVWPDGPVCPHCGGMDQIGRLQGQSTRARTYKCYNCRKPFTVKVGTMFEHSKVPMYKWLQAMVLCRGRKHHINANQVGKVLGVTFKTAKTMLTLIRNERAER